MSDPRGLVKPGAGHTSGLWFSWVRYTDKAGNRCIHYVDGGVPKWDTAADLAAGVAERIRRELSGEAMRWLTR